MTLPDLPPLAPAPEPDRNGLLRIIGHTLNKDLTEAQSQKVQDCYAALSTEGWQQLFGLADLTLMIPGWYAGLKMQGWLDLVPELFRDAAEAAFLLNTDRNSDLVLDAERITRLLSEIECPAVYFKGVAHILERSHGTLGGRVSSDIDVLVPHDRVVEAARHLMGYGAHLRGISDEAGLIVLPVDNHVCPLWLPEARTAIELHYSYLQRLPVWPSEEEILALARPSAGHPSCLVPDPLHSAALALAHSFLRRSGLPGERFHIKDLWDVMVFCQSGEITLGALSEKMTTRKQHIALGAMAWGMAYFFAFDLEAAKMPTLSKRQIAAAEGLQRSLGTKARLGQRTMPKSFKSLSHGLHRFFRFLEQPDYRRHMLKRATSARYRAIMSERNAHLKKH